MLIKFISKIQKIFYKYSHFKTLINKNISKTEIIFLGKVKFIQETIFYGNGKIIIGNKSTFGYRYGGGYKGRLTELQPRTQEAEIIIGENIATNNGLFICCAKKVTIGDNTLIGSNVTIMDHNAHGIKPSERRTSFGTPKEVLIGKNVWIGNDSFIMPGTEIGDNSIIGAGSIVKGGFPPNVIIAGNPAIIIKKIEE